MNNTDGEFDPFLNPVLSEANLDLYLVRTRILEEVKRFLSGSSGVVLDVGCGQMPYRSIAASNQAIEKYLGLDIDNPTYQERVRPDLIWDGLSIPLETNSVDAAMATEVFEHVPQLDVVLHEIRRVLKPGGKLFFTVPFLWPLHDVPYDEYRYTPFSLRRILESSGYGNIQLDPLGGWHASMAQMLGLWLRRAPMDESLRRQMTEQLMPLYRQLLAAEERPVKTDRGTTMITGLCGTATADKQEHRQQADQNSSEESAPGSRELAHMLLGINH